LILTAFVLGSFIYRVYYANPLVVDSRPYKLALDAARTKLNLEIEIKTLQDAINFSRCGN
jgi:hypothetical protein